MKNDYQIIVEKKYYAVFTDGEGKQQKVEVTKEVADTIIREQQAERALVRKNERYTISLDALDYEGEVFATNDDYKFDAEEAEMTNEEKVRFVLKQMKPRQAGFLERFYLKSMTQSEIAKEFGISQATISKQIAVAEKHFKKLFEEFFGKGL